LNQDVCRVPRGQPVARKFLAATCSPPLTRKKHVMDMHIKAVRRCGAMTGNLTGDQLSQAERAQADSDDGIRPNSFSGSCTRFAIFLCGRPASVRWSSSRRARLFVSNAVAQLPRNRRGSHANMAVSPHAKYVSPGRNDASARFVFGKGGCEPPQPTKSPVNSIS
jgi:hypothetical protein